jgi:hypothetical protein
VVRLFVKCRNHPEQRPARCERKGVPTDPPCSDSHASSVSRLVANAQRQDNCSWA